MAFAYHNGAIYDQGLERCPKCGGVVVIIGMSVACTECGTVWTPKDAEIVKAWWNDAQKAKSV